MSKSQLKRIAIQKGIPSMHPQAAVHEEIKQYRRDVEEVHRRNTELWIKQFRLRFVHVRRMEPKLEDQMEYYKEYVQVCNTGGATIAYTLPERKGGNVIRVAIALVHENDVFCKRTGRYHAAMNYYNGRVISLRVPATTTPATFLKETFGHGYKS